MTNNRRGQTLIIAIMVMFILSLIAAIFIGIVARNLFRSERYSNVDAVAQIADAGVRYADKMLTSSEDGADWRPAPDHIGCVTPGNVITGAEPQPDTGQVYASVANWEYLRDNHPDFKWVRAYWPTELPAGSSPGSGYAGPTGGFSTFATGGGRFLLRVSYDPNPGDALSKYIKIESIGRWGGIERDPSNPDQFDPTTLRSGGSYQLRRELTAFKPIGLTDYLRFITNKDNRPMDFPLGVPGFKIQFGRTHTSRYGPRGGPVRVNGNLLWYGDYYAPGSYDRSIDIYLRGISSSHEAGDRARLPVDKIEVSGDIKIDRPSSGNNAVRVMLHEIISQPDGSRQMFSSFVEPSESPSFTTFFGFYRDGRDGTDAQNMARGVKRIEPPAVDQTDPTNTTTRYRLLTLNSGDRVRRGGRWINLGQYGWGRGVYINNSRDSQDESQTLFGGYTLRTDWLKPNNPVSAYWVGPYYVPPGCILTLHPVDTDGDNQPDFTITRTDAANARGKKPVWYDADGRERPEWGATVTMPYPDPSTGRWLYSDRHGSASDRQIEGNGVIYAEGNIRIRGMLPPGMQLTIASNENIYIEGNLLKYRDPSKVDDIDAGDPYRSTGDETITCGLALLARKNVVVNTTQFFRPLNFISADDVGSDAGDGRPPYHLVVTSEPEKQMRSMFEMGPFESENGNPDVVRQLYLRHSGQYGPSYINVWLNPGTRLPDGTPQVNYGMLTPNVDRPGHSAFGGLPSHIWGIGDPNFNPIAGAGIGSVFAGEVFPLDGALNARFSMGVGIPNILQLALDQTTYTRNNYLMGAMAIQPLDIRIEAILFAQEGSFFVIPGVWFNPNPADSSENFDRTGRRPAGMSPMFPFFGQALDVRIVVDGSVTENTPAAVSDVEEWMTKWGMIPGQYGSSSESTAHPGEGITMLYDDHVGWPVKSLSPAGSGALLRHTPIRADGYGRALPIAPKLPVCRSLIYSGDIM